MMDSTIINIAALGIVVAMILFGVPALRRSFSKRLDLRSDGDRRAGRPVERSVQGWIIGLGVLGLVALLTTAFAMFRGPEYAAPAILVWAVMLLFCWVAWKNLTQQID